MFIGERFPGGNGWGLLSDLNSNLFSDSVMQRIYDIEHEFRIRNDTCKNIKTLELNSDLLSDYVAQKI